MHGHGWLGIQWQCATWCDWAGSSLVAVLVLVLVLVPTPAQWRCPAPRYLLSRTRAVAMEASIWGESSDDP